MLMVLEHIGAVFVPVPLPWQCCGGDTNEFKSQAPVSAQGTKHSQVRSLFPAMAKSRCEGAPGDVQWASSDVWWPATGCSKTSQARGHTSTCIFTGVSFGGWRVWPARSALSWNPWPYLLPLFGFPCFKAAQFKKPPFGSTGVKAKGRVKVRGWGMVKAETGAGSRSVARTRTGAGPGPEAAPCFCRWLTTGLHHGIEPISGLFSPVQVIYCVLFVSRTSPTFVNTSSLTSVTPFKAGISVWQSWNVRTSVTLQAACWLTARGVQQSVDCCWQLLTVCWLKESKKIALFAVLQCVRCGKHSQAFDISLPAACCSGYVCISVPDCLCLRQRMFSLFSVLCHFDCVNQ